MSTTSNAVTPSPHTGPSPAISTHPLIGVIGVLFGAMVATMTGRLISVGLLDLRSALHLGVDEASWIGTAFNAGLMFIGPFSVYLGGLLGPRRVLLFCASIFTVICLLLPLAVNLPVMLALLVLAGLTSGTFYPLTLSFVLRNLPQRYILIGIAMYAMDILFTTNFATSLEAWYVGHLSWRWIFWNSAVLTPVMMILIRYGIPWQPLPQPKEGQPKPTWRGFLYASLGFSLLYTALDQGQRLDWLNSGTVVGLIAAGVFLLAVAIFRRLRMPNPMVNFPFLARRNTLLLGIALVFFRFVLLATVVVLPSYLGSIKGYLPLQTGPVLLWVALPQCLCGILAVYLLKYVDARFILAVGFALVAVACLMNANVSAAWSGGNFMVSQFMMAIGFALSFNALVGAIILEALNTGALKRPIDVLTFSGYFQTIRIFGGEIGVVFLAHCISVREQFHSNMIGQHVTMGSLPTVERILGFGLVVSSRTNGAPSALGRAAEILALQVRQQAYTLAIADAFMVIAWAVVLCLVIIACMARVPTQYQQITSTPAKSAEGA